MDTIMADILHNFDAIAIDRADGSIRLLERGLDAVVTECEKDADDGHFGRGIHMEGFPVVVSDNPLYIYSVLVCRGFARRKRNSEQLSLF